MGDPTAKNPSLFRQLQEPHESVDALNTEVTAFLAGVGELREKHRIAEVLTVITGRCLNEDGEEVDAMLPHYYGDSAHAEGVAAYAYGIFTAARQE